MRRFLIVNDTVLIDLGIEYLSITANDKENLNEIFSMILLEIQNLKGRLTKQESKIQSQELRIQTLELNQKMQDTNIKAFDIARLFRFYFLDDIITKM